MSYKLITTAPETIKPAKRVKWEHSENEACIAAVKLSLAYGKKQYVFANYLGMQVDDTPPPFQQRHYMVDGREIFIDDSKIGKD